MADEKLKNTIKESIKRLQERPPSQWNAALVVSVKQFLFPKILFYLDGEKQTGEKDAYSEAQNIFK